MQDEATISIAPGASIDVEALLRLRHVVQHIPERKLAPAGLPGGFVTKRRGRGLETNDIRPFTYGDDIRHIDHNTTARTGETHVRTFHDEREKTAILIADFRPSMLWGTRRAFRSVAAAEALTLAGWRVIEGGGRVGLVAISADGPLVIKPKGRARGMVDVIGGLATAHSQALEAAMARKNTPDIPLVDILELANRTVPTGGAVYLATALDNPGARFDAMISSMRNRARLSLLLIRDAFEIDAPGGDYSYMSARGSMRSASLSGKGRDINDQRIETLERIGVGTIEINASHFPEQIAEELGAHGYFA